MISKRRLMKFIQAYPRPKIGDEIITEHGPAIVSRFFSYRDVVEEMRRNGLSKKEIEQFDFRVEHFLGKTGRYFECELTYPDGETTRIDWSEYYFCRGKKKPSSETSRILLRTLRKS